MLLGEVTDWEITHDKLMKQVGSEAVDDILQLTAFPSEKVIGKIIQCLILSDWEQDYLIMNSPVKIV